MLYVCMSGQWKVKLDLKQKKGQFVKLNGDIVRVSVLYHSKYLATMEHVVELKAQVTKAPTPSLKHPFTYSSGLQSVKCTAL